MKNSFTASSVVSGVFSLVVFGIGVLNLLWVHPVPGLAYMLLSFIYVAPLNTYLQSRFRFSIPVVVKLVLGIILIWFTLGPSDLGDIIDSW